MGDGGVDVLGMVGRSVAKLAKATSSGKTGGRGQSGRRGERGGRVGCFDGGGGERGGFSVVVVVGLGLVERRRELVERDMLEGFCVELWISMLEA